MVVSTKLKVDLLERSYYVNIGENLLSDLGTEIKRLTNTGELVLITNEQIWDLYGRQMAESLKEAEFKVLTQVIPEGESYKSWKMAERLLTVLLKEKYNRDALLLALGGGVIGDLAGFVASIYQRGISFIQIPTTLLAQVDSSVGGKVAVNHPLGKNMIGAFHQPLSVLIDLNTLKTLKEREWQAGLAEVVKYGVIWDKDFFGFLETKVDLIKKRNLEITKKIIFRACQIKALIVSQDEREQGLRAILNFGHTLGHALEKVTKYQEYRHGEAVAIGMVLASKLAQELNMFSSEEGRRLQKLLINLGLPIRLPQVPIDLLLDSLLLDKKVKNKELIFILPESIGRVKIVPGIDLKVVRRIIENYFS